MENPNIYFIFQEQYTKDMETYKKSIDQDQLKAFEEAMEQKEECRSLRIEKRHYDKMLHELGKPKKPLNAYLLFRLDRIKAGDTNSKIGEKWSNLNEKEREKYIDEDAKRREMFKLVIESHSWIRRNIHFKSAKLQQAIDAMGG